VDQPSEPSPALDRVLSAVGTPETVARLAGLSGSDFTTLMLEVARRRAAAQTPATVMRRYRTDRFVRPASTSWRGLRRAEDLLAASLPTEFELLTLAPVVPLGAHSALGPVSQDKVITAMRACEVAADPTNALALEAAARRLLVRDLAGQAAAVRLAAFQRVVRSQFIIEQPGYLAHFSLLGVVTAGRDEGGHRFQREAMAEQVGALTAGISAATGAAVQLLLTPLSDPGEAIAAALVSQLAGSPLQVGYDRARESGRGYYRDLCFKINVADQAATWLEVGDGGFTDWVSQLTASMKERLLISGIGMDRVAMVSAAR
jgi:hypothetical protein